MSKESLTKQQCAAVYSGKQCQLDAQHTGRHLRHLDSGQRLEWWEGEALTSKLCNCLDNECHAVPGWTCRKKIMGPDHADEQGVEVVCEAGSSLTPSGAPVRAKAVEPDRSRLLTSKNESRLLAALQRYGTHADYCAMYKGPIEDGCNCGLFEAMGLAPDGKPLSGDGSQVETSARLTDDQCESVIADLEIEEWNGISKEDVRMWARFIDAARFTEETSARCPGGEISSVGGNATAVSSADSASSLGKAAASDGVRVSPEADARTSNPNGTFTCPVCGYDKPHYHPPGSIRWYEKHLPIFKSLMENDWPFAEERTHYPASHSLLFYSPRINALWQLYQRTVERSADETCDKQPDWETEYKKLAGVYSRTGLEEFIEKHFPGSKLVDLSAQETAAPNEDKADLLSMAAVVARAGRKTDGVEAELMQRASRVLVALAETRQTRLHQSGQLPLETNEQECRSAGPSGNAAGTGTAEPRAEARSSRREVTAQKASVNPYCLQDGVPCASDGRGGCLACVDEKGTLNGKGDV